MSARRQQQRPPIGTRHPGSNKSRGLAQTTARVPAGTADCLHWYVTRPDHTLQEACR